MRIRVQGPVGQLAEHPESALSALADMAAVDGADRDEWLEKAIASAGAESRSVPVDSTPRYQVARDGVVQAVSVYNRAMVLMREAIRERLDRAAREADPEAYRQLLRSIE